MSHNNYCQSCLQILGRFISSKILDYDEEFFKPSSNIFSDPYASRKCFGCAKTFFPLLQGGSQPIDSTRDEYELSEYGNGDIHNINSAFSTMSDHLDPMGMKKFCSTTSQTHFSDGINWNVIEPIESLVTQDHYNNDIKCNFFDNIKLEDICPIDAIRNERVDPVTIIPDQKLDEKMDFELNRGSTLYRTDAYEIQDLNTVQSTMIARDHGVRVNVWDEDESSSRELKNLEINGNFNYGNCYAYKPIRFDEICPVTSTKEDYPVTTNPGQGADEKMDFELNSPLNECRPSEHGNSKIHNIKPSFSTSCMAPKNDNRVMTLDEDKSFLTKLLNELHTDFDLIDKFLASKFVKKSIPSLTSLATKTQLYFHPKVKASPNLIVAPDLGEECTISI